jgi:hypothetical protein
MLSLCNIHDCIGPGVYNAGGGQVANNIIAKCGGYGIEIAGADAVQNILNNTIDGNAGGGIIITTQAALATTSVFNNIISNHTAAGTYGISVSAGTVAANDMIKPLVDYNSFYNNTTNYSGLSAGAHDTAPGTTPYVASSTENYTLA